MRIILNSDILYTSRLVRDRLPSHLEQLARESGEMGATLVVPRTAFIEVQKRQNELVHQAKEELRRAGSVLAAYGALPAPVDPESLVREPDLIELLRAAGARVEFEEPLLEDYRDAETRAAWHSAPLRPGSESDEMRDLVIWAVACRIARRDNGAILLSRDEVHSGEFGEAEASSIGLQRVTGVDPALAVLGVENPAAKLIRAFLTDLWPSLRKAGLPLSEEVSIRRISAASFVQGHSRLASMSFDLRAESADGTVLNAGIEIEESDPDWLVVRFEDRSRGIVGSYQVLAAMPPFGTRQEESLADLRRLLEGP